MGLREYEEEKKEGIVLEIIAVLVLLATILGKFGFLDSILLNYPEGGVVLPYFEWLSKNMLGIVDL